MSTDDQYKATRDGIVATHTIQVSDDAYRRLRAEANRLQLTPEQLIERLLTGVGAEMEGGLIIDAKEQDASIPPPGSPAALAAVQRLTTLFGDLTIPDLERVLTDPSLSLANVDLVDLKPCAGQSVRSRTARRS